MKPWGVSNLVVLDEPLELADDSSAAIAAANKVSNLVVLDEPLELASLRLARSSGPLFQTLLCWMSLLNREPDPGFADGVGVSNLVVLDEPLEQV